MLNSAGRIYFIAFKLLALLRDRVFRALRRLAPAKLEGREKGDLIAVITSDIELPEVFYAHTISPALIALLFSAIMAGFIGWYHPLLGGPGPGRLRGGGKARRLNDPI